MITDGQKVIEAVWFNQPYILTAIRKGQQINIAGPISQNRGTWSVQVDEFEINLATPIHTSGKIPVYPETHGISSRTIREKIAMVRSIVHEVADPLPHAIRTSHCLLTLSQAVGQLHSPRTDDEIESARKRLAFDELFMMQLSSQVTKQEWNKEHVARVLDTKSYIKDAEAFVQSLPFSLTSAQVRVYTELTADLGKRKPMNRLLQGDVGSGKTVIAALGAFLVHKNGLRTLLLAPTELLAHQHHTTFLKVFEQLPKKKRPIIALITGSTKLKNVSEQADIIIGTHALFTKNRQYDDVGLVIIDEQHKFGVKQRATLKEKGMNTHLLTMTATPIPRTVYLVRYGELDISIIDELPVGRKPQQTFVVPKTKQTRMHEWINTYLVKNNAQMFVVCPFIDESEVETLKNVKAAQVEFERLKSLYPKLRLKLLHGKMLAKEKQQVMDEFREGKYDILVTTPIIEVGVDIPRAQIIVIETAERFGLAQLHQLRGRVGAGEGLSHTVISAQTRKIRIHVLMSLPRRPPDL
ncbi:MAG: ATP-dependent DNA helicase RecG [Microgenomates bacterium OLB22]|nr:MAG: ATP-dependent DNA helicase RecG [Microgenomates bacterium OLB22]